MRNIILVAIAVFLTVLLGGGAIVWYFQADAMKKSIEDTISNLNKQGTYITYSAIETSGFPLALNVSIVNPRFNGEVDKFLVTHFGNDKTKEESIFYDVLPWTEDLALDGHITLGINTFSDQYTLTAHGNWKDTTTVITPTSFLVTHNQEASVCKLKVKSNANFLKNIWNFSSMSADNYDLFNNLRSLECNSPSSSLARIKEGTNEEELLVSQGPAIFLLTQDITSNQRKARIYFKSTDIEFTQQGSALVLAYMNAFDRNAMPPRLDSLGKQNTEFDISFTGPIKSDNWADEPMTITLSNASVDNQTAASKADFNYSMESAGEQRNIKLSTHFDISPKEGYDDVIANKIHDFFHRFYVSEDPKIEPIKTTLHKFDNEKDVHSIIAEAIPKFEPLKKLFYGFDGSYQGNKSMTDGQITLNDLQIGALPYGITGNGIVKNNAGKLPEPHLNLICRGCIYMIDDIADFANRLQQTYAKFSPEEAAYFVVKPAKIEAIKDFARALATTEATPEGDLSYKIIGDGTINITINGKGLDVVQNLYMQYFPPAPTADTKP
ncbi:MAG: hypothetical protein EBR02_01560 [Alphaproteobacteria bacterium]|nr:hypothetical protein [Alphaproteobacteria bacterium]